MILQPVRFSSKYLACSLVNPPVCPFNRHFVGLLFFCLSNLQSLHVVLVNLPKFAGEPPTSASTPTLVVDPPHFRCPGW